jgi:lipopolysaccharide biosynthesis regulator YciM
MPTPATQAQPQGIPHPDAFYVDPNAARSPKTVKSAMMLGDFYCREGKYDEAIEAYQDRLRSDPSNA